MYTDDIIAELKKDGMELKPETVKDVVTRYHNKSLDLLLQGYHVNDGLVYMHASVKGALYDKTWNPEKNHIHVAIAQGAEMRKAIAETSVEIIGEHPEPIAIYSITDLMTKKTDSTITQGFNAEIKGTYIKVTGDKPECGIHFRSIASQTDYAVNPEYISVNEPSRIIIIVPPSIPKDIYELRITTQFTGANKMLKEPRTVIFSTHVTVE
jgi:hypothetical protein